MTPTLSVVIPHYGDPSPAVALTESLLRERPDLEVIIADDHSPIPFPDLPGVRVVRRERNGGFGSAVNTGAALASGDLLLILNSDLTIPAGFLDDLVAASQPWQPAVTGPRIIDADGVPAHTARHFPRLEHQVTEWLTPLARWRDRPSLQSAVGHDLSALGDQPVVVDWLVGAALLLPRSAFEAVGGFDETFFMNSEEVDLQRRLRALGVPSVALPGPVVTHLGGGSSDPAKRRQWVVDSRLHYAAKWGGRGPLRVGLSAATAANLLWNTGRRLAGAEIDPLGTARTEWRLIWGEGR